MHWMNELTAMLFKFFGHSSLWFNHFITPIIFMFCISTCRFWNVRLVPLFDRSKWLIDRSWEWGKILLCPTLNSQCMLFYIKVFHYSSKNTCFIYTGSTANYMCIYLQFTYIGSSSCCAGIQVRNWQAIPCCSCEICCWQVSAFAGVLEGKINFQIVKITLSLFPWQWCSWIASTSKNYPICFSLCTF